MGSPDSVFKVMLSMDSDMAYSDIVGHVKVNKKSMMKSLNISQITLKDGDRLHCEHAKIDEMSMATLMCRALMKSEYKIMAMVKEDMMGSTGSYYVVLSAPMMIQNM